MTSPLVPLASNDLLCRAPRQRQGQSRHPTWLRPRLFLYLAKGIEEILQLCRVGAAAIFKEAHVPKQGASLRVPTIMVRNEELIHRSIRLAESEALFELFVVNRAHGT
jgi:hypothetical protein